jgi:hypothetical protein
MQKENIRSCTGPQLALGRVITARRRSRRTEPLAVSPSHHHLSWAQAAAACHGPEPPPLVTTGPSRRPSARPGPQLWPIVPLPPTLLLLAGTIFDKGERR